MTITNKENHLNCWSVVHHTDCVREYGYDKGAENVLQRADERNWSIVRKADDFSDYLGNGNNTG